MDANLPGWLIITLVTCTAGVFIVQYATFEDLDMHSPWPVSHVGVLMKARNGSLWVVHNNGNGTYSMPWSEYRRRWTTHHVKVSAWRQAWNGSTVEGATQIGSQKYDLLLDNCYNARDTVVGYFSGALTASICLPNRMYCGYQLEARFLNAGRVQSIKQGLFQCKEDGLSADLVYSCSSGCIDGEFNSSFCACRSGWHYCGYELHDHGWLGYEDHALYLCIDDLYANHIATCSGVCVDGAPADSFCKRQKGMCTSGTSYCGHKLIAMGWDGYESDTLYLCDKQGNNASLVSKCKRGTCKNSTCDCLPGRTYCAYQLYWMGWTWYTLEERRTTLTQCTNGTNVRIIANCKSCLSQEGGTPHCMCISGNRYCGHKLLEMGWEGYKNNTLYLCSEQGTNASVLSICEGPCGDQACNCVRGKNYCGHELIGWLTDILSENNTLYRCTNGTNVRWIANCKSCLSQEGGSPHCMCTSGTSYCGHKLIAMGWEGYESDTLYLCDKQGNNASLVSKCKGGTCKDSTCDCLPGRTYCGYQLYWMGWTQYTSEESRTTLRQCTNGTDARLVANCKSCLSQESGSPHCMCKSGTSYCGRNLIAMGWDGYENNTLYVCGKDGKNASILSACQGGCSSDVPNAHCPCMVGSTYCGHELYSMGWIHLTSESDQSSLRRCTKTNNVFWVANCKSCLRQEGGSPHCMCISGNRYCGHKLLEMGWEGYENNTLYLCSGQGANASVLSICESSCDDDSCSCVPGKKYCGHELIGWTANIPSTHNTLYRCTSRSTARVIANCKSCLRQEGGSPHCMCKSATKYCGHYLLEMGWEGYENNTLYVCGNDGKNVSILSTCQGRCRSVPNDHCPCTIGSTYCGHELYSMGWIHLTSESDQARPLNPKILYQCTNGAEVLLLQNCTGGCQSGNGANAYCLSMPTPWYWFVMGTTLPLLFVGLVGLLMRTIIKHRRLRAFVQQHRIDASQLALTRKLGCGQFGEVWMGNYKGVNGQQTDVALKISKHHLDTLSNLRLASADCFFQESVALDFLRHKNITRALGICSNLKDGNNKTTPALILEYMNGGNSIDYILAERGHLIGRDLKQILIDICQAGVHLHKMGVVHRDIGARNVLIQKNPQTRKPIVAKLTDFGLAKDIGNLTGMYKSTNPNRAMFHPGYTAPEGFTGEFSSKSDVWSFGVFMWEVYTLMDSNQRVNPTPYYELSQNDILGKITNGHRLQKPSLASSDTYAVMTDCWRWQTESRPTFDHLLKNLKRSEMDLLAVEDVVEPEVVEPVVEDAEHVVDYQEDPTLRYMTVAIVDY